MLFVTGHMTASATDAFVLLQEFSLFLNDCNNTVGAKRSYCQTLLNVLIIIGKTQ